MWYLSWETKAKWKNTDKYEAGFLYLEIKIRDGKFQGVVPFDKIDSFRFSLVRMPDKSSNKPSSLVYSVNGAESLSIARASNNSDYFSTTIKSFIALF